MTTQLMSGTMLRHKKRIFSKAWRDSWVILYSDSAIFWFKGPGGDPEGCVVLREAPELVAYGRSTDRIPFRPGLPPGFHVSQLLALGTRRGHEGPTVHWFLCKTEDDVVGWMTAISNTLPPPTLLPSASALHKAASHPSIYSSFQNGAAAPVASGKKERLPKNASSSMLQGHGGQGNELAIGMLLGSALATGWGCGGGLQAARVWSSSGKWDNPQAIALPEDLEAATAAGDHDDADFDLCDFDVDCDCSGADFGGGIF